MSKDARVVEFQPFKSGALRLSLFDLWIVESEDARLSGKRLTLS